MIEKIYCTYQKEKKDVLLKHLLKYYFSSEDEIISEYNLYIQNKLTKHDRISYIDFIEKKLSQINFSEEEKFLRSNYFLLNIPLQDSEVYFKTLYNQQIILCFRDFLLEHNQKLYFYNGKSVFE